MANDVATADARLASTVEIAGGKLCGASRAGICSFKGIPYGASPAGRNRFMPPEPPQPWAGVREASAYAGHAWQLPNRPKRRPVLETLLGPADATPEAEDCLTLNVWTPGLDDDVKRPVMVWLHGGAFGYGSGNRAVTDGANLARRGDVVVVSVNHRLNIFGFLHLADIGGPAWAHSGNVGVLDLIAALGWDRYDFGPVVDGSDLPQHPADPVAPAISDDIPLMVGGTREESAFFLAADDGVWNGSLTETELRERLTAVAGSETDAALAAYRSVMPQASPADRLIAALTGSNFWIRTVLLTERYAARRRAPVYMYSLDWQSPAHDGRLKAHHAMDLPFVFDNTDVADTTSGAPGAHAL